jgi:nifR3 family TIM-barrel protein
MHMGFWKKLKKPILVLAPMADVTDAAYRHIIAKYGKPDAMWTEFVSADGLFLGGYGSLIKYLQFDESERPIVAQFFTSKPEEILKAARLAAELGFDGVDINMGCPDCSIEKQKAGASLMKNPELARKLIRAAKKGAGKLPVSVKTRIGYNKDELETWLSALLEEEPAVIIVHARTRKEMSKVPARWERVKRAVEIRDEMKKKTLIFGNGDVTDREDALKKASETGCDGVMIGRAIFGNPWLMNKEVDYRTVPIEKKLKVLVEHTKLFEKLLGDRKSFAVMKKHFKAYVSGWNGAKELRIKIMKADNAAGVEKIVKEYLKAKSAVSVR